MPKRPNHRHGDPAPARIRSSSGLECWECELVTSALVSVVIGTPGTRIGRLWLCPDCYRTAYVPLARTLTHPVATVGDRLIVEPSGL